MAPRRGAIGRGRRARYEIEVPPIAPGTTVRFLADRSDPYRLGSLEHYWHYLLGFLLPLAYALHSEPRVRSDATLRVPSCGPLMDQRTTDLLDAFGCDATIEPNEVDAHHPRSASRSGASRRLTRRPRSGADRSDGPHACTVHLPRWDVALRASTDPGVRQAVLDSVAAVLARAADGSCGGGPDLRGRYLLLVRSPSHPFYESGGGAQNLGYGTGRRVLHGHDDCLDALTRAGVPGAVYEPGAHSLLCQARTFAGARGCVALRGAELANLVWMSPDSLPVMLDTGRDQPPPQRMLAATLGLRHYLEIAPTGAGPAVLDPDVVVPLLVGHLTGRSPTTAA